jgi:hypothetical protein
VWTVLLDCTDGQHERGRRRDVAGELGCAQLGEAAMTDASRGGSHGNEPAIIANVDQTVLLEDRAEEGVEDHRRRRVRDNTRLLVKLLGEKVNTKISVLAGLSTSGDANDLARTMLQDHKITNADVVTGDSKGALRLSMSRGDVRRRRVVEVMVMGLVVRTTANGVVGSRIKIDVARG